MTLGSKVVRGFLNECNSSVKQPLKIGPLPQKEQLSSKLQDLQGKSRMTAVLFRVSMEGSNWLVSWFITYLRDLRPTYTYTSYTFNYFYWGYNPFTKYHGHRTRG